MRWLAYAGGVVAVLALLRWIIVRFLPWDPEWMNDWADDDGTPFEADPYVLDLMAGLSGGGPAT